MKKAVLIGVAKKVYDESRKPENQARLQKVIANMRKNRR